MVMHAVLGTTFTFAVLELSGSIYLSLWPQFILTRHL